MLADKHRVEYYQNAINKTAQGKNVLEIGTGPFGLWAINCARAGATDITSLEASKQMAMEAKAFVSMYGYTNIRVENSYSKEFIFSKSYDLVVHEIIGDFVGNEGVADVLCDIQQRTGSIPSSIPRSARSYICPTIFPSVENIKYPNSKYPLRTMVSPSKKMLQSVGLEYKELILSEPQVFEELKFEESLMEQLIQDRSIEFIIKKSGSMCGLLVTNEVEVLPGISLGTKYAGVWDHWYCNIILLPYEIEVEVDDVIHVQTNANLTNYETVSLTQKQSLVAFYQLQSNKKRALNGAAYNKRNENKRHRTLQREGGSTLDEGVTTQEDTPSTYNEVRLSRPSYSFTISVTSTSVDSNTHVHTFHTIDLPYSEQSPIITR